ncbi:MAG TPA: hypothetical protein VG323_20050, partial [Thermoanaerobaculia bacterium]|nr:hypothetical protein [Thermoanaerobaculia bacterium]
MNAAAFALILATTSFRPVPEFCPGPVPPTIIMHVNLIGEWTFGGEVFWLTSSADATYYDCWHNAVPHYIQGEHIISQEGAWPGRVAVRDYSTETGSYSYGTLGAGVHNFCYFGYIDSLSTDVDQNWVTSAEVCVPPDPDSQYCDLNISINGGGSVERDHDYPYECEDTVLLTAIADDGYEFVNWTGAVQSDDEEIAVTLDGDKSVAANFAEIPPPPPDPPSQCSADWVSGCSPIVINLESGAYQLSGSADPVRFDISGNGIPTLIGWTARGANEAFLCLDRDHDGEITSGVELFGTATPLKNGQPAANGYLALAEYDDNQDGVIDEHDAIWIHLLLWRDLNHDGISEQNELTPISQS